MNEHIKAALLEAIKLKATSRAGWLRVGLEHPESVAAHSWGVAWLVLLFCPPEVSLERALQLAIVHDLAEVRVGDITPYDGLSHKEKVQLEADSMAALVQPLHKKSEILASFEEYSKAQTPEAKLVHQMDKLDMALQAQYYAKTNTELDFSEFISSAIKQLDSTKLRELAQDS